MFQDDGAGLIAAAMIAIVPGYISRSVAGSYDNEGIAIFCMLLTYYLWIKASHDCLLCVQYMLSASAENLVLSKVFCFRNSDNTCMKERYFCSFFSVCYIILRFIHLTSCYYLLAVFLSFLVILLFHIAFDFLFS